MAKLTWFQPGCPLEERDLMGRTSKKSALPRKAYRIIDGPSFEDIFVNGFVKQQCKKNPAEFLAIYDFVLKETVAVKNSDLDMFPPFRSIVLRPVLSVLVKSVESEGTPVDDSFLFSVTGNIIGGKDGAFTTEVLVVFNPDIKYGYVSALNPEDEKVFKKIMRDKFRKTLQNNTS